MPAHSDHTERKRYLPLFWDVFLEKIDDEWEKKYAHIGSDRYAIKLNDQLANAIHQDIQAAVNKSKDYPTLTSKLICKYLDKGGLPTRIKTDNLQILLLYCGYEDWQVFKDDVEYDLSSGSPGKKDKNNSFRNPWHYLGPVLLALPFFSFF